MRIKDQHSSEDFFWRRQGFTLIEMTLVMWAGGIVFLLGTATLLGALKVEKSAAAGLQRQTVQGVLADQFRADVSGADVAPGSVDQVKASTSCLILHQADGRHIIYRWEENQLDRLELAAAGENRRRMPLGPDAKAVEFVRSGPDGRLLTLRLSETRGYNNLSRSRDFSAALGGDLR